MNDGITCLQELNNEIDKLIADKVTVDDPKFTTWYIVTKGVLAKLYGDNSKELSSFENAMFEGVLTTDSETIDDEIEDRQLRLKYCKAVFDGYIRLIKNGIVDVEHKSRLNTLAPPKKVFLVHGHNEALKQSVARLLENQGINPIILSEQANQGKTVIEKFESYGSSVGAAICLFTNDDLGKQEEDTELKHRARQNVVLETGYFIGKLGRGHIVFIATPDIELPSDLQGVVYTNENEWDLKVLKELKEMGFGIDLNKLCYCSPNLFLNFIYSNTL